ncbi:MAG: prolipoprotein diacylglyceryl transferase [Chloroflexota bacterium]|nr:prolipoprotein diacylglyceryl transferase [Chloroflexota bacterium]
MNTLPLLDILNWGWLRIGPPYIYVNIDPVLVHLGPLALRWYGLMYVVGIIIALWVIKGYTERKGVDQDMVYRVLWWCIAAGLIGGRLYFVIQQPNLVSYYFANPIHIIATWEGGMAFFGAIFLGIPTLIWRARVERVNPLVLIDAGVLFAAAGQIFGRIGNLINGDIVGYPSTLPWSTVYTHPDSWACLPGSTICNVPVQPAAGYELLTNVVLLLFMLYLARRVTKPGVLMLVYLFAYAITQFFLFFVRDNIYVKLFGVLDWHLKQAQWTSLFLLIFLIPITYLVARYSKPVPRGEVAATYGIAQKPVEDAKLAAKTLDGETVKVEDGEIKHIPSSQLPAEPKIDTVEDTDVPASEPSDEPARTTDIQAGDVLPEQPTTDTVVHTKDAHLEQPVIEDDKPVPTKDTLPEQPLHTDTVIPLEEPLPEHLAATPAMTAHAEDTRPEEETIDPAAHTDDTLPEQIADEPAHAENTPLDPPARTATDEPTLPEQPATETDASELLEDTDPKIPAVRLDKSARNGGNEQPGEIEDTEEDTFAPPISKEEDKAAQGR